MSSLAAVVRARPADSRTLRRATWGRCSIPASSAASISHLDEGRLNAHVLLAGRAAAERRYHSRYGKKELKKVADAFGRNRSGGFSMTMPGGVHPRGEAPRFFTSSRMPSTGPRRSAAAMGSRRCLCSCSRWPSSTRSSCIWQRSYSHHDNIWLGSGGAGDRSLPAVGRSDERVGGSKGGSCAARLRPRPACRRSTT